MSFCKDIVKIEEHPTAGDLLRVTISTDGVDKSAYWFFNYADALPYVNKDVIVDYRQDIYKGELHDFINTFVRPNVVNTLDKHEGFKLYCEQEDNNATLSFNEIEEGETRMGCIVFCVSCEYKSSKNAVWQELVIRDKSMHVAKLRCFDYDNKDADFTGKYIVTSLSRNKFGFNTDVIKPMQGECPENPEIALASQYILNYFANDAVAMDFITKTSFIDFMKQNVDFEAGYGLMRLAMELSLCDTLNNIARDVDVATIGHILLMHYAHVTRSSVLSPAVNNIFIAQQYMWPNRKLVVTALDAGQETVSPEAVVVKSIKETVDSILQVRKGTVYVG